MASSMILGWPTLLQAFGAKGLSTPQWCVFNNSLLGIKNYQISTQSSKLTLIWKAKVLQEKIQKVFWKGKLIFIHDKKDKGPSSPPKLLRSKSVIEAKMNLLKFGNNNTCLEYLFSSMEIDLYFKRTRIFEIIIFEWNPSKKIKRRVPFLNFLW